MAGASVDDVFVIVMFSSFVALEQTGFVSFMSFAKIPAAIILGIAAGILIGFLFGKIFKQTHIRDTVKIILIMSISLFCVAFEDNFGSAVPFSAMIAVMCIGISMQKSNPYLTERLSARYGKLWVAFEILLFTLVGACIKTNLSMKERLFCMLAYIPKATVQAAIGGVPLAMGLSCGEIVLTVAVLSIIITAPLGAFLVDITYKRLLKK